MVKTKPIDFAASEFPALDSNINYKYSLVDTGSGFKVTKEPYDNTDKTSLANKINCLSVLPLFGRACPLCVPHYTSVALMFSKRYVLFCVCCGRYFYNGTDGTDYTDWVSPDPAITSSFEPDLNSGPVEYALYETGILYEVEHVEINGSISDVRISKVARYNITPNVTPELQRPEYRRLEYTKLSPLLLILALVTGIALSWVLLRSITSSFFSL